MADLITSSNEPTKTTQEQIEDLMAVAKETAQKLGWLKDGIFGAASSGTATTSATTGSTAGTSNWLPLLLLAVAAWFWLR
jgi:hypothetical protein